jgi:hypothetical protein
MTHAEKFRLKAQRILLILGMLTLSLALSACQGGNDARGAIQAYIQALVEKDVDRLSTLSCADWEEQARIELDAFAGVKTRVEDLECQESGETGEYTLVVCAGKIIASYGNEDQEFPLDRRPFLAIQESGEWLMCGYQ